MSTAQPDPRRTATSRLERDRELPSASPRLAVARHEPLDEPRGAPLPSPEEAPREMQPPGRVAPAPANCGLSFERAPGPVVLVCGLHGGAGTSTLAYALAAQAARESPHPVLLCESEAAAGDVATLTAVTSDYSLSELAAERDAGRRPKGFIARHEQLRVIAGVPGPAPIVADGAITGVVAAARARHALTVIDAGTLRAPGTRELLQLATHVIWVTTAQPGAAQRNRTLLASPLVPALPARQLLAVRAGRRGRGPLGSHGRELRRLADDHCDRLVFIADSPGVTATSVDLSERRVRDVLTALAGFLTAGEEA